MQSIYHLIYLTEMLIDEEIEEQWRDECLRQFSLSECSQFLFIEGLNGGVALTVDSYILTVKFSGF